MTAIDTARGIPLGDVPGSHTFRDTALLGLVVLVVLAIVVALSGTPDSGTETVAPTTTPIIRDWDHGATAGVSATGGAVTDTPALYPGRPH